MSFPRPHEEQAGTGEDETVQTPEGGQGDEERHCVGHHTQHLAREGLRSRMIQGQRTQRYAKDELTAVDIYWSYRKLNYKKKKKDKLIVLDEI